MENEEESLRQVGDAAEATDKSGRTVIAADERVGTLVFAAILTLFGIFWVWASSDLPNRQQTAYLSQGFLPITAGILLAGLSAMLFLSTWLTKSKPAHELGKEPVFAPRAELVAAGVFVLLLGYILVLPEIHYAISTFLLMVLGLALAGEPLRLRLLAIAVTMTGLFYLIFIYLLQLPLPGSMFS